MRSWRLLSNMLYDLTKKHAALYLYFQDGSVSAGRVEQDEQALRANHLSC